MQGIKPTDEADGKTVMLLVTNWKKSTAYNYIRLCRTALNKKPHHILQVEEFCNYYGIKLDNTPTNN